MLKLRALNLRSADSFTHALRTSLCIVTEKSGELKDATDWAKWAAMDSWLVSG